MAPQELVDLLLTKNEEQGLLLVRAQLSALSESARAQLVYLLKCEADRQWYKDARISYALSGYLLLIGTLTLDREYHALGLLARGDALRRMDRYPEALQFFDAAGKEFLEIDDEVSWARVQIPRISTCLQLNRTSEALHDAASAREIFMRHSKWRRAGQIDVNVAIVNYELGQHEQALHIFDRAIET